MPSSGKVSLGPLSLDTERVPTKPRATGRDLPTSPFVRQKYVAPTTDGYEPGDRVTLDSWGMGKVVEVTPDFVVVDFGAAGIRRIPAGARGFSKL